MGNAFLAFGNVQEYNTTIQVIYRREEQYLRATFLLYASTVVPLVFCTVVA